MAREPIGLISHNTIGRTAAKRRDAAGIPIEETVPSLRSVKLYDLDGNEVMSPVHCHRAFVPGFDDKYRPRAIRDRLKDGFLEAGKCPHMPREQLDDKPSIEAPPKFEICDGKATAEELAKTGIDGCKHLVAAVLERRKRTAAKAAARKNVAQGAAALQLAQALAKQSITSSAQSAQRQLAGRPSE